MRHLSWFALGFSLACLVFCYLAHTAVWLCAFALLLVAAFVVWLLTRPRRSEHPPAALSRRLRRIPFQTCRRMIVACLGAVMGLLWCAGYQLMVITPTAQLANSTRTVSGHVISYPVQTSSGGCSVTVRLDGTAGKADVLVYGSADWDVLQPGDHIVYTAEFRPADRLYGNESTYYTARGIYLLAYTDKAPDLGIRVAPPLSLLPTICAHKLKAGIYAVLDDTAAPLAVAVTLGDKSGLSSQLQSALSRSGLMHAAVVSGTHISFLVCLILFLSGGRRRVAFLLVPFLFFYAWMAGGSPSAVRAAIMAAAALAGPVFQREPDAPSALGFALLILLIQNPFAAASISLQMSFCAASGILLLSPTLRSTLLRPLSRLLPSDHLPVRCLRRICYGVVSLISVSLGAMLFTVPLSWAHFRQIVLAAPLSSVLTMWAVTLLMIGSLAVGSLAIFFPAAMAIPGAVLSLLSRYIIHVANQIGRFPLSSLDGTIPTFVIWLAVTYLLIGAIVLSRHRKRQAVFSLASIVLTLALAVGANALTYRQNDLTVIALDVGHGSSTLFLCDGQSALVDCGGNAAASAGDIAADTLSAMGRHRLDILILTHLDSDHCNGLPRLFQRLQVSAIYIPGSLLSPDNLPMLFSLAEQENIPIYPVNRVHSIPFGSAELTVYPPLGDKLSNESGLLALCSHGTFDALVTGDASAAMEQAALQAYHLPDLEVFMVGHHGSAASTCPELLNTLCPELAVISVGYNHYGHPSDEVLDRLAAAHVQLYRTDQSGTVTICLRGNTITMK